MVNGTIYSSTMDPMGMEDPTWGNDDHRDPHSDPGWDDARLTVTHGQKDQISGLSENGAKTHKSP